VPHLAAAVASDPAADPTGQTRIGAGQALASIGRPEGIAPVRAALARAELVPVRCQLAVALAALLPPGGVPEAAKLLEAPTDDERAAAAEALSLCPTPGTAAALRRASGAKGLDATRRILLATALLGVRDASGGDALVAALADGDAVLRRRAFEGLDRFVEGVGPFDAAVRDRWEGQRRSPRFRARCLKEPE
jgi:HEAT repeat protein